MVPVAVMLFWMLALATFSVAKVTSSFFFEPDNIQAMTASNTMAAAAIQILLIFFIIVMDYFCFL